MKYFKSLEFYFLFVYLECIVKLIKVVKYLHHLWNKIILRKSFYTKNLQYPFEIKDVEGEIKQKLGEDFHGEYRRSFFMYRTVKL